MNKFKETHNVKIHKLIILSYGLTIFIYSLFSLLTAIIPTSEINAIQKYIDWSNYFFKITALSLFKAPFNFIIAYGLIRQRHWSRYAVIGSMATLPIYLVILVMMWGEQSFSLQTMGILVLSVILTLLYFSSKTVKTILGGTIEFRIKSWSGLLVACIMIAAISPLITSVYLKIYTMRETGFPFFENKPQLITSQKIDVAELSEKYQKIRLLDTSLWVPKGFGIRKFMQVPDEPGSWTCSLYDNSELKRGYIMFGNSFPYKDFINHDIRKRTGLDSTFDYEKFLLTNNWNPAVLMVRMLVRPISGEGFLVKEIHANGFKGFIKRSNHKDSFHVEFSLYNKDDDRFAGGTFLSKQKYFSDDDILKMLSSFEFLKPEVPLLASSYYEKGMKLYNSGDIIQAQYELANAYYLSPLNPSYIYAFTKTLPRAGLNANETIQEMIDVILKIDPGNKDAQLLLKEIEPQLLKEIKNK